MPGPISSLKTVAKTVLAAPPVNLVRRWAYEREYAAPDSQHRFRGVFGSFEEAAASAPGIRPLGYDNPQAAAMYRDRLVFPEDYAVLFWLKTLLQPGSQVFDYGGHIGALHDICRRLIDFPRDVKWTVYDVPAVVGEGLRLRAERGASSPEFTSTFDDAAAQADIVLASGSLQYVEQPFAERLRALAQLPPHLLINQTPLHESKGFVTLQNIGTAYCPYAVIERGPFVRSLEQLGYELVQSWSNPGKECPLPTYPAHSLKSYSGMYLRLRQAQA